MFRAIDDFLIDSVFQRIADFVHEWTGCDSVFQAKVMLGFQGMFWAAIAGLDLARREPAVLDFFLALVVLTAATFSFRDGETARWASRNGMRNPTRLKRFEYIVRITLVMVSPFAPFGETWPSVGLFFSVFLNCYLECCDVQQPRKGRLREWCERLTVSVPAHTAADSV